jgi:histidinol-phosphate aminotransferase
MSRFLSQATKNMAPYVPGEQPQDKQYIKLNTNECPYSPSLMVGPIVSDFETLRLYPDPESAALRAAAAAAFGVEPGEVFAAGGSDEALAYTFMAFFDRGDKVYFPDITYGFYKVYADLFALEACELPLDDDFTVNIDDYAGLDGHIVIANPNAPTGICLEPAQIETILKSNPDRLVVLDEAYIDFAPGMSCLGLIRQYDNLLVVQTFSKSRALAGMRLSFSFANPEIIAGLERIKYSFNPYNIDRVSGAVAMAALRDREYLARVTGRIIETRARSIKALESAGFEVLPSQANFLFARAPFIGGGDLYEKLKEKGVLVRHFDKPRIRDFVRVTVGTDADMQVLMQKIEEIKKEAGQ